MIWSAEDHDRGPVTPVNERTDGHLFFDTIINHHSSPDLDPTRVGIILHGGG